VAGEHGARFRSSADSPVPPAELAPSASRALLDATTRIETWAVVHEGLLVERKSLSVALHFRARPELGASARRFAAGLAQDLAPFITLQPGKMVMELRLSGPDKGDAVRRLMAEAGFRRRRPLVFGDDLTDEPAFAAAADMGGAGIIVGPCDRPTAAVAALAAPADLRSFVTELLCR
jgi:trehalose 6-phosphate phosphatase